MPRTTVIKPTHKAIQHYYQALKTYGEHHVKHEAWRRLFSASLRIRPRHTAGRSFPSRSFRSARRRSSPTARSATSSTCQRGYWEAKDTDDDLDAEIAKKIDKGYPLSNIIFEDTRRAVLFQDGTEALRAST